jgi:thioredoxin reductase
MGGAPARRFFYRDRVQEARPGETVLAAISRDGLPTLERSQRYRRPRAPFCGVGQCTGCLVRVNGRPLVRSCRAVPSEGDRVEIAPGWPSVRHDLLGVVDLLFPRGLDPFRSFRRPAFAAPLYQRVVRRLSGYGALPSGAARVAPPPEPPTHRDVEVAVVGAGPSGRSVAARLAALHLRPLLVDRDPRASAPEGVDLVRGASVTVIARTDSGGAGPSAFTLLGEFDAGGALDLRARAVVVATGGYDASLLFAGNDRPGVLTAEGALALSPAQERAWFRRAVVVGSGPRAAAVLERFGHRVAAVVAPGAVPPEVVRLAADLEVPLYPRTLLLGTRGRARVRAVELAGRGRGPRFALRADAVVLAHRRVPNSQLLFQAGAEMVWHAGPAAYYPTLDAHGQTTVPGLFAVGEAGGFRAEDAAASGARAAEALAGRPTATAPELGRVSRLGPSELEGYYRELFAEPRRGRWIACRCEDVLLGDVDRATRAGYRGIEVVKRHSSLGAGLCQGRYCLPDALVYLAIREGRPAEQVGYIRQRPPVFPMSLGALASLDPEPPAEAT